MIKVIGNEEKRVSKAAIARIIQYLRVLQQFEYSGKLTTSSEDLSRIADVTAFKVRKDLANFGRFGQPGVGYNVSNLRKYLSKLIDGNQTTKLALVGVGNLGSALLNYKTFDDEGLRFVAAFDRDKRKVGRTCGNVVIEDISNIKMSVTKKKVQIGVIAVPGEKAQEVVDSLIKANVFSILNFAPAIVSVPEGIMLRKVDLSIELKSLRYFLTNS